MTLKDKIATVAVVAAMSLAAGQASAGGSLQAGEAIFQRCALCHSAKPGQNLVGPTLFGVVGRPSASVPGFDYSSAMKSAHKVWNSTTLNTFLANPRKYIPGTKMIFVGVPNAQDRSDLITYLDTLK